MEERELEKIISLHNDLEKIKAEASRKELSEITAIIKSDIQNMGDLFHIEDGVAHIPVVGELSEKPNISASLFGQDQTTYGSIIDNIAKAENDLMVEKAIFHFDTPGGTVAGADQTAMAIRNMKKPTEAHVHNMSASAGYLLAAQTGKIIAMTPMAELGSIGVAAEIIDKSGMDEKAGIKRHVIVSTGAENKRIDPATKAGQDKIRERINETHKVFVRRVAEGRGVSEETVRENFGKGGLLIASKALEAGMIDGIMDGAKLITSKTKKKMIAEENKISTATEPAEGAGKNNEEVSNMTKEELRAQNPDLYKEIFEAGIKQEWDRVSAHLIMGAKSGAMDYAVKCIQEKKNLTDQAVAAEYLSAGMNKKDLDSREKEDDKLGDLSTSADDKDNDNVIFAKELFENLGLKEEAI
jgi:ClpP class serine protease